MKHIFKKSCLSNLKLANDEIICNVCGRQIGYAYYYKNDYRIKIFKPYKLYESYIREWVRLNRNKRTIK